MRLDRYTVKSQEAVQAASGFAAENGNPEVLPLHLMAALLEDREPSVARAAHAALKELTGQDLGPSAGALPEARAQALAAWKEWWQKQNGK